MDNNGPAYPFLWRFRKYLGARHNTACKVIARGIGRGPRNVLVEFQDGFRAVGTRYCVRRARGIAHAGC